MTDYKQPQTVSTDALATLGTIIDASCGRDAIHLAVENVMADEQLFPGQPIAFVDGKAYSKGKHVGIVDPFLRGAVYPGQRFWLVVFPRQITSLRHVWEHPDFPPARDVPAPHTLDNPPVEQNRAFSVEWMTRWARKHMSEDYYGDEGHISDERAYAWAIDAGHNHSIGPYESARDHIDDEWWNHWETITGEKGDRDRYFSCAC